MSLQLFPKKSSKSKCAITFWLNLNRLKVKQEKQTSSKWFWMPIEFLAPRNNFVSLTCFTGLCGCHLPVSPTYWHRDGSRKFEHTRIGRKQKSFFTQEGLYCRTSSQNFVIMKTWVQNGSGQIDAKPIKPQDYWRQILVHTEINPLQKLLNFTGYWQSAPGY